MTEDGRNILVGVLALIALGLLSSVTFGGKSVGAAASGGYVVQASFNRIDGLNVGDEVRMSGIKIGEVSRMRLGQNFEALVDLRIDNPVGLPTDTSAAIHTDGLFGSKHVVLVPGADETELKAGGRIDLTQDSVVVTDLLDLIIGEAKSNAAKRENELNKAKAAAAPESKDENPVTAPGGLLAPLLGDPPAQKGDE
ncbi:MAG: putative toluene tolerance protein Ttg2C [Rhodospirillales bacterium]|jgi:phospholipid/cholesterol/gamma-HCH transport system substrate-binding protein|nr:putative toluene tolerance protein Ttg2C [Rhodospirillales bacterium]